MTRRLFLVCFMLLSVISASADESAHANRLFVEAVRLIQTAATDQNPTEQLRLLENALSKLHEIIEKHPSTDLAVKLISGQDIGDISLIALSNAINSIKRQSAEAAQAAGREACLQSLDTTDPQCAEWLPDIVLTHLMAANPETALEAAMTTEQGPARDNMLNAIARHYAQAGKLKEGLAILDSMHTERARAATRSDIDMDLDRITYDHLEGGNIQAALRVAKSIDTTIVRDEALYEIAVVQLRAGNIQEALTTTGSIDDGRVRQSIERHITGEQRQIVDRKLQAGNVQDALATAMQIADAASRNRVIGAIATRQLQTDDLQGAISTTQRIQDSDTRSRILDAVANTQMQTGNASEALSTAQRIQDPTARDGVFARIAHLQLQTSQIQQASQTAKLIQTAGMADHIWVELTRLSTLAQDFDNALAFANLIADEEARETRLLYISQGQLHAGDIPTALSIAQSMKTGARDNVFQEIAQIHTQAGDLSNALSVAKLISNDTTRQTRLYFIAQGQLQAGDIQAASSTTELMASDTYRDEILNAIQQLSE